MSRWTRRILIAAPLAVLAGAVGAPYLSADRLKEQIRVNLERLLRRKVDLRGEARFQLYPSPGVSLSRVVVHELPELGVEPIAYLDYPESSLDVSLSPLGLFLGRVRVTGVRLVAPSLNISKAADGRWTFQPLLEQVMGERRAAGFDLDALEVRGGRLNLKVGNVKSVYYLADTDLRVEADSSNRNRYGITIEGDPARTDRTVSSFGRLTGRGMLTLARGGEESRIDLNLSIERTPIAELVLALQGRSAGIGGFVASQAKLSGPLSAVVIEGRLELNEADRFGWLLSRASSARGLGYKGLLNWTGQELRLSTGDREVGADPVSLRMRATDLFQQAHWAALLGLNRAPLSSMRALVGELGLVLPVETPVEGSLSGVIGYSSRHGTRGQLAIADAAAPVPNLPPTQLTSARVLVDNRRWWVPAAEIRFSERETVTVETAGDAGSGTRQVAVATAGLGVERSRQLWKFLAGGGDPPFFDRCGQGQWAGAIRFEQDGQGDGTWSGDVRVTGAVCAVDGIAEPAHVDSAQVSVRGPAMQARRLAVKVGTIAFTGEVDHDPRQRRHTRLRLSAPEVAAAELERLLLPSLRRDRGGFLSRTLGRRLPLPEWLGQRRLDAQLRIAALTAGDAKAEGLEARLAWDGEVVEVLRIGAAMWGGAVAGRFRIGIDGSEPAYRGHFDFSGLALREARVDAAVDWETQGVGAGRLLTGLQAQGKFSLQGNPLLAPEPPWESAVGTLAGNGARWQFANLQVSAGGEQWQGQASSGPDGRLQLDLSSAAAGGTVRSLKATGRLW